MKRTTIWLDDIDIELIHDLMRETGATTMSQVLRMALRHFAFRPATPPVITRGDPVPPRASDPYPPDPS